MAVHRALVITILTLMPWAVNAAVVNVGDVSIRIPTPPGFARLTPSVQPLYDLASDTTNPNNRRLVTFVDEDIIPKALAGEAPTLERFVNVEVMRKLESVNSTRAYFEQLKSMLRNDLERAIAKVEQSLPERMADLSGRVSETLNVDLALSLNNVVPLPVHNETERASSHSMFIKYAASSTGGETDFVVTLTTTFLFLKGKILYVYVYGGPRDLAWTRSQTSQVIEEIFVAN